MTAETNRRTMERFTREFLTTGDAALAKEFLSPDVVLHFAGQQQRGRDTYLGVVAANAAYVRAANGPKSHWYQAAIAQGAGRVRVAGQHHDVKFEAAGDENEAAIDAAYEAKYPGSSAVPTMQGEGPKSASVRISPR